MTLSLTLSDWIVCTTTFGGSLLLGLWLARRVGSANNSADFFLAGRRMSWPIIGASLFATNIGAEHVVGLSGDAYRYGLSAGVNELNALISLGIAAAILYPHYIRNRVYTIGEFLEIRYNPTARLVLSGFMICVSIMTKMAFTLFAGALVLHSLMPQWDVMEIVWVLGITAATLTILGGFAAVAYTDTIQTVIMIGGCFLMTVIGLVKVGGWNALAEQVPQAMQAIKPYDDPHYPFLGLVAISVYAGTFYWGMDQVNAQRVLGAPNLKQGRWGVMFAILLKFTPFFIFAVPGVIALALFPGRDAQLTFVTLLNDLLPSGIRGLVLAALLAALVSSLLAVMNSISTMVVRDFVIRLRPLTPERTQVQVGRMVIVVAMLLGVAGAYLVHKSDEGLYKYLLTISIYLVMPIMPPILFGILSRRVTLAGALASVVTGIGLATLFALDHVVAQVKSPQIAQQMFPLLHTNLTLNFMYRGLWGTLVMIAVLYAVSWFTKKTDPDKLEKTTVRWGDKREPFEGLGDWRLQLAVLAAVNVSIYVWLW